MKTFAYVDNKDHRKLVALFFILLLTNIFELLGIGLIPLYILTLSSYELTKTSYELTKINSIFELQFLSSLTFYEVLLFSSLSLILFFIVKNILTIFLYKIEIKIFSKFVSSNASKLFKFYLERPYSFFENTSPSEIIKNISISNNQAAEVMRSKILIIKELVFIFFVFVLLFSTNIKITLSILIFLSIVCIIFYYFYKKKLSRLGSLAQQNQQEQMQILNDSFNGIKEVKIFKIEKVLIKLFNNETENLTDRHYLGAFYVKLPRIFYEIIAIALMVFLIFLVLRQNQDLTSALPILSLYFVALMRFIPSFSLLNASINYVNYFKKAETIVLSKLNIIRESKNKNENSKSKEFDNINNELCLELNNLNFSYSSNINKKIIDDLNLIIEKGEKICIYGKSGEGKSTLIDLIIGLIKPSSGSIKFNKQDVNTNLNSWLKLVTYVPQKVFVFDDSLIQNICFKQILSEDEKLKLEKILAEVKLKELIDSLPDGINTNLGNMGFKISGGQMQRIGIARALFRDPKIIILDESTNSLDKKTEQDILSIFNGIDYKDKIIISISHDNQTFKYFDKILFLKNGKISPQKKMK